MGMFNIYDEMAKTQASPQATGMAYAKLAPGRGSVALAGQGGQMMAQGAMGAMGMKTPAQQRQEKINQVRQQFPTPTTDADFRELGNALHSIGETDMAEKAFDQIKSTGKVTAAQQQNLADMDATLDFLEVSKGYKLNPKEAAYFKARIKKDVSLSMSGQVVDTAPNVFDQLISARKGGESSDGGIGDTGLTEAGLEKQVGDLATRVIKADLSGLDTAISQAEEMITSYKGKDIPGLSKMNVMERMTAEGSKNATRVKSVSNILMKLRSGAAVTESEAKRFSEEMSSAPIVTDELWIDWLSRLRLLVDERKRELYAGVPPEVIELYQSRQGKKKDKKSRTPTQAEQEILSKYNLK